MIKEIKLELHFNDNFVPPERFDPPLPDKNWDSKCKMCPFYRWDDEYADGWCEIPAVRDVDEECPIKKFFN